MNKLITVGQLLDQTWDHYRDNFKELMTVSAWMLILAVVDVIALSFYPPASKLLGQATYTGAETFGVILSSISSGLLAPLLGLWLLIALARLVRNQLAGRPGMAKKAMSEGFQLFGPALYISLLILAVLVFALVIGLGPAFILAAILQYMGGTALVILFNLLLMAGLIVSFVLVLIWGVRFVLAPFALFLEDKRGLPALKRSQELIKGRFWSVLLRLAVPKLLFIVIGVLLLMVVQYVVGLGITGAAGLNIDVQLRLGTLTQAAVSAVVVALINPLIVIADLILYKNLMKK